MPAPRNLRITGPTELPDDVRAALAAPPESHRGAAFRARHRRAVAGLARLVGTADGSVLLFTASGTGGLEAAVVNTVAPGDRVLAVVAGQFGRRFADVAAAFGADVEAWEIPWGSAADPDGLRRRLRSGPPPAAVLLTHNETSTGVLHPLADLAAAAREASDALLLVDAVSSLGAVEIGMDARGLDVVVGASQKALMAPAGLAPVAVSPRALAAAGRRRQRRYYFDFPAMAAAAAEGSTAYTPAIHAVFGLEAALARIEAEGFADVCARHRDLAARCRGGALALGAGLALASDPAHASPTVTALRLPEGRTAAAVREALERDFGVFVAQGRGAWKDRVIRIGHMGHVGAAEVDAAVAALGEVLRREP